MNGVGFVKQVGFKPGREKEMELDEQSGQSKEKEVMGEGIGWRPPGMAGPRNGAGCPRMENGGTDTRSRLVYYI